MCLIRAYFRGLSVSNRTESVSYSKLSLLTNEIQISNINQLYTQMNLQARQTEKQTKQRLLRHRFRLLVAKLPPVPDENDQEVGHDHCHREEHQTLFDLLRRVDGSRAHLRGTLVQLHSTTQHLLTDMLPS